MNTITVDLDNIEEVTQAYYHLQAIMGQYENDNHENDRCHCDLCNGFDGHTNYEYDEDYDTVNE